MAGWVHPPANKMYPRKECQRKECQRKQCQRKQCQRKQCQRKHYHASSCCRGQHSACRGGVGGSAGGGDAHKRRGGHG
eukprot:364009-Chlamydomonas_euryale.AAC.3